MSLLTNKIRRMLVSAPVSALLALGITVLASRMTIGGWNGVVFGIFVFIALDLAFSAAALSVEVFPRRAVNAFREQLHQRILYAIGSGHDISGMEGFTDVEDDVEHLIAALREWETRCRELAERMAEQERLTALGELAAGVAHELNNPLGGIVAYSHLLLEDTDPEDPRRSNIQKIIRESNRCKMIIKSLLDYARQSEPVLNPVNVNDIIVDALGNLVKDPIFNDIRVIRDFDESVSAIPADSSQIQEVFENIIRNAAEIMEGRGDIIIRTRMVDEGGEKSVETAIEDTGPGIPEECIAKLFAPFFTTRGKGHGTGLGLSVSYGNVRRHHGTITAANRHGGGAVFTVRLPCGMVSQ